MTNLAEILTTKNGINYTIMQDTIISYRDKLQNLANFPGKSESPTLSRNKHCGHVSTKEVRYTEKPVMRYDSLSRSLIVYDASVLKD